MIKVAMITRSTLYSAMGGDTIQVMQTAQMLHNHGYTADIRLTHETIDYNAYQLLHFFNITRPADIVYHIRKTSVPFVVSTILINYSEYDKYQRRGLGTIFFRPLKADQIEYIKSLIRWIKRKDHLMSVSFIWRGQRKCIAEILEKAALLLPNSASEYRRLTAAYNCNNSYVIIPNAVSKSLFCYNAGLKKDTTLVLCVARVEGIKNQLTLIKALNNTKYTLLIIGAAAPNQPGYYKTCRRIAAANVHFINQLPQEQLVAYYQKAKVHVLASWFETTGLSSLEAAAMGCSIVITDKGDTKEYFSNHAVYCSPSSPADILAAVNKAATLPVNEVLQQKIANNYTWQEASRLTAEAYKKTIPNS